MAGSVNTYDETVQGQIDRIIDAKAGIISALQNAGVSIPSDTKIEDIQLYIGGLTSNVPYNVTVSTSDWSVNSAGGYMFSIPASKHEKGKYPSVKTYTHAASGSKWEETYDSPEIDISTGDVIVYSNVTDELLVVIR